jgi:hypothetical protein
MTVIGIKTGTFECWLASLAFRRFWFQSQPLTLVIKIGFGIMATSDPMMGVEPTPETSCLTNIPQTVYNVQHNVPKNGEIFYAPKYPFHDVVYKCTAHS